MRQTVDESGTELLLGKFLRAGVLLAGGIVASGGLAYLARHGMELPHYSAFKGEPSDLRNLSGILHGATTFHSRAAMQAGLVLLIGTPIARVALSVVAFARERDYTYVLLTLLVLALLAYSLFGSAVS